MSLDLDNQSSLICAIEPIHLLSQIQPSGVLFVVTYNDLKVLQVSDNIEQYFDIKLEELLTKTMFDYFNLLFVEMIIENIEGLKAINENFKTLRYFNAIEELFCVIHLQSEYLILEITKLDRKDTFSSESVIFHALKRCEDSNSFEKLTNTIVEFVKEISGFDRVLLYKFDDQNNGTVLTQSSTVLTENFVGHHFPASDIPSQARRLYIHNKFRIIEDISASNANIYPTLNPITQQPIDMTFCYFRSVSSMHIQYLKNMGVSSSMSISIVIDNKLWGLIACHHYEAKKLPLNSYETYYILSSIFSSMINQKEKVLKYKKSFDLQLQRELCINSINQTTNLTFPKAIMKHILKFSESINSDDCVLFYDDMVYSKTKNIVEKEIKSLVQLASKNLNENLFYTHKMGIEFPNIKLKNMNIGGFLAVKIEGLENSYLLFFRKEQIYTIKWAGEPTKLVEFKDNTIVINPRASFESWKETVIGTSAPFLVEEIESGELLAKELKVSYDHFLNFEETRILKQQHKVQEQFLLQNAIEKRVFLERERLLNSIGEGVYGVDLDMKCFFINPMALEMLLLKEENILGKNPDDIIHNHNIDGSVYNEQEYIVYKTILHEKRHEQYDWLFKSNGEKFPVKIIATPIYNEKILVGVVVAFIDISRQYYAEQDLQKLNQKLRIQAITDPLTQLYNQRYFKEYGLKQFEIAKKEKCELSMLIVGIKHFAKIKKMYGNDICDALLIMVSNILKSKLRDDSDIIARIGWEEFIIVLPQISPLEASNMMEIINLEIQNESIFLNGIKISCTASVAVISYDANIFINFSDFVRAAELKLVLAQKSEE